MDIYKKTIFTLLFAGIVAVAVQLVAQEPIQVVSAPVDSVLVDSFDIEITQEIELPETEIKPRVKYVLFDYVSEESDSIVLADREALFERADSILSLPENSKDDILYRANPLLIPLVFQGKPLEAVWDGEMPYQKLMYGEKFDPIPVYGEEKSSYEIISSLRKDARTFIAQENVLLYTTTFDRLPSLSSFMFSGEMIEGTQLKTISVYDDKIDLGRTKIEVEEIKRIYWTKRANTILQFSQNHVSPNWHQGGNSHMAFLSIVSGEANYNNRKNVIWENKMEWRMGYNRINSENALRSLNINDDLLRLYSKYGLKARGNWYYSVNAEASTQIFNNYRSYDSDVYKARFLTPIRANVGVGMDYKYKQFSMMVAPLSFKYIYLNDTVTVDPNQFGIEKGVKQMKQFGSSLRTELKIRPAQNWNMDSRLSFYTDYKRVEIDLEVINNFVINRFLTARLLLNPRFDNTIILKEGEKYRVQFKELLSIGFSYRFI